MSASAGGGARRRLPRSWRLTSSTDLRALFAKGKRSRTAHLDVFDSASPLSHPRAGVIVPKHKQTIARRNKLKRQLREIVRVEVLPRLNQQQIAVDVLVRARREAYDAPFGGLRDELVAWAEKRWQLGSSWP